MLTSRLHKWFDSLPEPRRIFTFLGLMILLIVITTFVNLYIGLIAILAILFDKARFVRKF